MMMAHNFEVIVWGVYVLFLAGLVINFMVRERIAAKQEKNAYIEHPHIFR